MKLHQLIRAEKQNSRAIGITLGKNHATNQRTRRVVMALLLACLTLLVQPQTGLALLVGGGFTWSVLEDQPVKLVVCWENPAAAEPLAGDEASADGAQRREWARLALKTSWERHARIIFVGWGTCQNEGSAKTPPHTYGPRPPGTGDENIKIQIINSGASDNPAHGSWGDHQQSGLRLNLHCDTTNNTILKICIQSITIHEVGHALGFYHEEERKDWRNTAQCPEQWSKLDAQGTIPPWWPIPDEVRFGLADTASIMSYCAGAPTALSAGDVAATQYLYKRHLPGTLLNNVASLCLSAHAQDPNGELAFGWECDEALDDQEWHFDWEKSAFFIRPPASDVRRCLDVDTTSGSNVQTWDCNDAPNQQWQFQRVILHGYGGLCLTRPDTGPGALTLQTCEGGFTQLWRLVPGEAASSMMIRAENERLCVTVIGDVGSQVVAEPCSGQALFLPNLANQSGGFAAQTQPILPVAEPQGVRIREFTFASGGEIRPVGTNDQCLDVRDVRTSDYIAGKGGPRSGQLVQLFDCTESQLNQKWNFTASIVSGEKCLTLTGDFEHNGSDAQALECVSSAPQRWDYYW